MQHQTETGKNIADGIALIGGNAAAVSYIIGLINGVLTTVMLLVTVVYTAYRIYDLHKRRKEKGSADHS